MDVNPMVWLLDLHFERLIGYVKKPGGACAKEVRVQGWGSPLFEAGHSRRAKPRHKQECLLPMM